MSRSPAGAGGGIDCFLTAHPPRDVTWRRAPLLNGLLSIGSPSLGLGVEAPKATRPEGLGPERLCNAAERLTGAEAVARLALQALCCKLLGELLDHETNLLGHGTLDRNLLRELSECLNDLMRQVRSAVGRKPGMTRDRVR
jgi:hypothetical protein